MDAVRKDIRDYHVPDGNIGDAIANGFKYFLQVAGVRCFVVHTGT